MLEKAARDGTSMQFGYMGSGWVVPDARQPCRVVSHAVVELPDDRLEATAPSVYSFYKAPWWSRLGAVERGVEADAAWSTSELRGLAPVFGGQAAGRSMRRTTAKMLAFKALEVAEDHD